jgi:hypothetical protein
VRAVRLDRQPTPHLLSSLYASAHSALVLDVDALALSAKFAHWPTGTNPNDDGPDVCLQIRQDRCAAEQTTGAVLHMLPIVL